MNFNTQMVNNNEKQYGAEIRAAYGDAAVDHANTRVKNMTVADHAEIEALTTELSDALIAAVQQGDPASDLARRVCELHKKWLCYFWDDYSIEAHRGVTEMYVADARFAAYYEAIVPGGAVFLRDAVAVAGSDNE